MNYVERRQGARPAVGFGARRCGGSTGPGRTCTSIRRSSSSLAASGSRARSRRQLQEAVDALEWYLSLSPNTRQLASATGTGRTSPTPSAQGTLGPTSTPTPRLPSRQIPRSRRSIGKIGFARWPKGPAGKRVTSIWNWGFPINAALPKKAKKATWLFIQWAASKRDAGATHPTNSTDLQALRRQPHLALEGNRSSASCILASGDNFVEAATAVLQRRHRRRLASAYPAMAGGRRNHGHRDPGRAGRPEAKPKDALNAAQTQIDRS